MAVFNKFDIFTQDLAHKQHNFSADVIKIALSGTLPVAGATVMDFVTAHVPPAAANGYTTGGNTCTLTSSVQTAGVYKLILVDTVFTATAGGIGPFRYAILYNTSTTAANKVIGWYDYGSAITLAAGETLTVDFDGTNGVLTLT